MSFSAEAVALPKPSPESHDSESGRAVELEDSPVAEPLIEPEQAMLEKKDRAQLHDGQTAPSVGGGDGNPDVQPANVAPVNATEWEESKLSERGIRSLTHSVTGDSSRPISEVEDGDAHFDETGRVSVEDSVHGSPPTEGQKRRRGLQNEEQDLFRGTELEGDDFEGADGEIDSVTGGHPPEPRSEPLRRAIVSPNGRLSEGAGNEEQENGEVIQASPELLDENRTGEAKLAALSGRLHPLQAKSGQFKPNEDNSEARKTDSAAVEEDDAASDLGTQSTEPQDEDEEAEQQLGPHSEISFLHPQQLDSEGVINSLSLDGAAHKRRDQQHAIFLEGEGETIVENVAPISKPQLDAEETNRSILPDSEEISPEQPEGISGRAVETGFPSSEVKERVRTEALPQNGVEDANELSKSKPGVGEAVLLGALASGVNRPTWFVVRAVLVGLVASLLLLLHVAIKSENNFVLLNVLLLISIAGGLIVLLGWYISEVGLVSVDKQIAELSQTIELRKVESKTL